MADHDDLKNPEPHAAPTRTLVDKVIEAALGAGGGAVTLLSGLLAAVLILYSGYVLYDTFATERAASSNAWDLLKFKPEIFEDYETPLSGSDLETINQDYRMWLTVYDTSIDYPVVQGKNDTYYAAVDIYGNPSLTGAIYLAAVNSPNLSDSYNVIYGHHMDSGAMFGALDHMTGNETGVIVTKDAIYDVAFFAVVHTDAYENRIYSVGNRMDDVLDFLRSGGEGGVGVGTKVIYFNENAAADAEKLVALSTCFDTSTSGRLVVIGKMTKRIVMKDVTVTKVWDDGEDQDGIRPESINVTASDGTKVELKAEENWTATVSVRKFDNLGEIRYTWEEKPITGYELISNVTEGDSTVLTNRHVPAVKDVSVRKVWDDDGNRDGIRPEKITVTLSNGLEGDLAETWSEELDEGKQWFATISSLPVYSQGKAIAYTWTEEEVPGYALSQETENDVTTLTNRHVPERMELTVSKVWNDEDNQDGIRPETLNVTLYGDDEVKGTRTLSEENQWQASIPDLYVYENGKAIEYRWEEADVDGYTPESATEGTATVLTNTYIPATKSLTVKKIWDDSDDQDGIRPESLWVVLSDGQRVMLHAGNEWTETVDNLPVNAAGQEIEYSWTEEEINGYVLHGSTVNGDTTTMTNRHETDTTVATVTKVWVDEDNRDGIRPESITVTLSNGEERVLSEDNQWTATVEGLPLNADGKPVEYTWSEEAITGYTGSSTIDGTSTTMTNTHDIATTTLSVRKEWDDAENQDGLRPEALKVTLNANGTPVREVTLTADKGWTAEERNLPVNENGAPISYTWTEEPVEGYTASASVEGTLTTLRNTHIPETRTLTVRKVWDDGDNQDGIRPDSLQVTLSNGQSVTLTAMEGWTGMIENLPVNAAGEEILYRWTEENVAGYELSSTVANGDTTTLTNTHVPETTSLTVKKVWEDDNDRDQIRPSTLTVSLLANGLEIRTRTLNSANEWSATVDDLPVYEAGQEIRYSWTEADVAGYTLTTETDGSVTMLTNTHEIETVQLTVKKVWDDEDNRDGRRPETLTVTLLADETAVRTVDLNEANEWTETVEVPANDRGRAIEYEWTEPAIGGYSGIREAEGAVTTFTNTHTPATTTRTITKEWDDAEDQDGVRPESLTVYLLANEEIWQTITLDAEHGWTYMAEDLPVYENGEAISYGWREERLADYPKQKTSLSGVETTFTNIHEPEMTDLTVKKVWDDADNQDGMRPEALTVILKANGSEVDRVTLSEENGWSARVAEKPVNAGGKPIVYEWDEGEIEGYTLHTVTNGTDTILTNTHETERTVATVTKVWDDDDDRDGLRPASLTVTLSSGQTVMLNAENNWTNTIENLPKYRNGQEIEYIWTEEDVEGYEWIGSVTNGTVTTITNRHGIITQELTVVKVWDDDENRDGVRPSELGVTLNNTYEVRLNAENGWTATVRDLPVYANGGRIRIYRWAEEPLANYTASMVTEGNITTITNTLEIATTSRTVEKIWDDRNNAAGIRPETVSMTLMANGEPARDANGQVITRTLSARNGWRARVDDLPVYANGGEITYQWTEEAVAGYELIGTPVRVATEDGEITRMTNRIIPPYRLTVNYLYEETGEPAAPSVEEEHPEGEEYSIPSPEIEGYRAIPVLVSGRMPDEDLVIDVLYVRNDMILEDLETPMGLGQVFINVGDCLE